MTNRLLWCVILAICGVATAHAQITYVTNTPYGSPPSGWQTGSPRYCYNLQTNNYATIMFTGNVTNGSNVITGLSGVSGPALTVGQPIVDYSGHVPGGTTITNLSPLTMSNNATGTMTGDSFTTFPYGSITFSVVPIVGQGLPPGLRIDNLNSNTTGNNHQGAIDDSTMPLGSGCVQDATHPFAGVATGAPGTYSFTIQACDNISSVCYCSSSDNVNHPNDCTGAHPLSIVVENTVPPPVAALPSTFIDTTYSLPTGGTTWTVGCPTSPPAGTQLQADINSARAGDVILLQHGCTYNTSDAGNGPNQGFLFPIKSNPSNKWIYFMVDDVSSLPAPGVRIAYNRTQLATVVPLMATIAENQGSNGIEFVRESGTTAPNYWRFVGIEVKSTNNSGTVICGACPCRYTDTTQNPPVYNRLYNCGSSVLFLPDHNKLSQPIYTSNITVDRCYIHGDPTHDVTIGIDADIIGFAVIDSWVSDIHRDAQETQAVIPEYTPGPIKIDDNYLAAAGESVFIGGSGAIYSGGHFYDNPYQTRDVQITNNQIEAQIEWDQCGDGGTIQPTQLQSNGVPCPSGPGTKSNQWIIKNDIEFKNVQRALVSGDLIQNSWPSGQDGSCLLIEPAGGESGNGTVLADLTIENNIVNDCSNTMVEAGQDYNCDFSAVSGLYPSCNNETRTQRINIYNNLNLLNNNPDGVQRYGMFFSGDDSETILNHNTFAITPTSAFPASSFYFGSQGFGCTSPDVNSFDSYHIYVINNFLYNNPNGDCGEVPYYPVGDLGWYEPETSTMQATGRLTGNVLQVPNTGAIGVWGSPQLDWNTGALTGNNAVFATTSTACGSPSYGNYELQSPNWISNTTDGYQAGVICSILCATGVCNGTSTLTVISTTPPSGTVGVAYSYPLAASGGSPPYTFSIISGTLPAGLNLVSGVITGTPTAVGTSSFTVQVQDASLNTATAPLTITINLAPPTISGSCPGGTVGVAYVCNISVSGGTPPYTLTKTFGAYPAGTNLSSLTISGTPTTAGPFAFSLKATDSLGAVSASHSYTGSIASSGSGLSITTTTLPIAGIGTAYYALLAATGGVPPYTWSLASGSSSLPPGLSLTSQVTTPYDGVISGVTGGGPRSYSMIFQVTDSAMNIALMPITLTTQVQASVTGKLF